MEKYGQQIPATPVRCTDTMISPVNFIIQRVARARSRLAGTESFHCYETTSNAGNQAGDLCRFRAQLLRSASAAAVAYGGSMLPGRSSRFPRRSDTGFAGPDAPRYAILADSVGKNRSYAQK